MDGLFATGVFEGFGPSRLASSAAAGSGSRTEAARQAQLKRLVQRDAPRTPGIYGMLNARGQLIYVGKAKCLRTRLLSYFRVRSRDPKAGRVLGHTRAMTWEITTSEFAALLRELELIQRWRPPFNVHGRPGRRRLIYICLGKPPARYAYLAVVPKAGMRLFYGPVRAGWRAREATRYLNDYFKLRDCPKNQPFSFGKEGLFPDLQTVGCLRYEIGTCSGPCLGACTRASYDRQLWRARDFLEGRDTTVLSSLEERMKSASAGLQFETAANLRNQWLTLSWLHDSLTRLRAACGAPPFVYPVQGRGGTMWYLVRNGFVAACLARPESPEQKRAAIKVMQPLLENGRRIAPATTRDMDGVYLVAAWFRRHPEERKKTIDIRTAIALCRP